MRHGCRCPSPSRSCSPLTSNKPVIHWKKREGEEPFSTGSSISQKPAFQSRFGVSWLRGSAVAYKPHPRAPRAKFLPTLCAPVPSSRDRRKGPTVAFSVQNSNLCTLVQRISTIVLICGTKFVPVTLVYHGYRYRAQISVIVNYLNDTTVGQYRLTL